PDPGAVRPARRRHGFAGVVDAAEIPAVLAKEGPPGADPRAKPAFADRRPKANPDNGLNDQRYEGFDDRHDSHTSADDRGDDDAGHGPGPLPRGRGRAGTR